MRPQRRPSGARCFRGLAAIGLSECAPATGTGGSPKSPENTPSDRSDALFPICTGTAANPSRLCRSLGDNRLRRGLFWFEGVSFGVGSDPVIELPAERLVSLPEVSVGIVFRMVASATGQARLRAGVLARPYAAGPTRRIARDSRSNGNVARPLRQGDRMGHRTGTRHQSGAEGVRQSPDSEGADCSALPLSKSGMHYVRVTKGPADGGAGISQGAAGLRERGR